MIKEYYVTLTGGKNNAGDFLIKYRAFNLFKELRPNRDIIDFNEWEKIDDERLKIINDSKGLILLGGPGFVAGMYPDTYPLRDNLDDITVPIILMGIGWKGINGDWKDSYTYPVTAKTKILLDKIAQTGFLSSVRDYHTLNSLQSMGYENFRMTGCPAYYELEYIGQDISIPKIKKVSFSLGVSFIDSVPMENQMKSLILKLSETYKDIDFEVVFHHSIDFAEIKKVYGKSHQKHVFKHNSFVNWLKEQKIEYVDISGNAENLVNYYSDIDLHIGYRVHAHIFMNSLSKFSILINEDGRGKGVKGVIGGIVIDGYDNYKHTLSSRVLSKIFTNYSKYQENIFMEAEVVNNIGYEVATNYNRLKISRKAIDHNYNVMKEFISQLP